MNGGDAKASDETPTMVEAKRLVQVMIGLLRDMDIKPSSERRTWNADMEKLLRIDGHAPADVERVLRWLHAGQDPIAEFWRANILSPVKLRSRWGQMKHQYEAHRRRRQGAGNLGGITDLRFDAAGMLIEQEEAS